MSEESADTSPPDDYAFDPAILAEVAELYIMGERPSLNRLEICERTGVDLDVATNLWRSLGFPSIGDDRVAFTNADARALESTMELMGMGVIPEETVRSVVRAMGQSFARLADWQVRLMLNQLEAADDDGAVLERLDEVLPMVEEIQSYMWRRHLASAASRIALRGQPDEDATPLAVGFVDIVGYTSRSRQISAAALAELVERFEQEVSDLVTEMGGQVIKTIGDEVLYTIPDPRDAVEVAVRLVEKELEDEDFPEVRVGSAYGPVLVRLGDVFGPTVNLAARLTSIARPSRVVIDDALADYVHEQQLQFKLKRMRRTHLKGFDALEPWSVRRPTDRDIDKTLQKIERDVEAEVAERTKQVQKELRERQIEEAKIERKAEKAARDAEKEAKRGGD